MCDMCDMCDMNPSRTQVSGLIGVSLGYYWGITGVLLGYYWGITRVLLGYYWGITGVLEAQNLSKQASGEGSGEESSK